MKLVYLIFLLLSITVLLFTSAYNPHFFQDDWAHLYNVYQNPPSQIANYFNLWQNHNPDTQHFYRPLPTKLYFYLMYHFFGLNKIAYEIFNIIIFGLNAILIYQILSKLVKPKIANLAWILYLIILPHFTSFSYIANIENLLFAFFTFAALLCWIKDKKRLSMFAFILALTCRESAMMIPVVLFLKEVWNVLKQNQKVKNVFSLFLLSLKTVFAPLLILGIYIISRTLFYGWPQDREVYQITFGPHMVSNIIKYLQWNLNLSGLLNSRDLLTTLSIIASFICFIVIAKAIFNFLTKHNRKYETLLSGIIFWLIFIFPVIFFSDHIDPWNLLVPSLGLVLTFSQLLSNVKNGLQIIFVAAFFLNFVLGLHFYSTHHWTKLRANIVQQTSKAISSQCQNAKIIMPSLESIDNNEMKYSWYYDAGPRLLCDNKNLEVIYP